MSIPRDRTHPGFPVHPGSILREDFLAPIGLNANALANSLNVSPKRISEIVAERRGITADTAYRLALYFGASPEFWTSLQSNYELALLYIRSGPTIKKQVLPRVMETENNA